MMRRNGHHLMEEVSVEDGGGQMIWCADKGAVCLETFVGEGEFGLLD